MCLRLGEAKLNRNPRPAREAERVFSPLARAFAQAVESLGQQAVP